ncbi:hypothetical protein [Clostridium oryzae]|uniref:Uncharacterized protein n=1 Tax=Clostridium oryzae TaxID=1450648 RepID=A0A1V4I5G0_9CLOT|nr:hypothetical protein [Clostridium oryzae]OPJ54855.1 hypothetical protein CLORY_44930 [Clostridium oryzae]
MYINSLNSSANNQYALRFQQKNDKTNGKTKNKATGNTMIDELQKQKEDLAKRKSELMEKAADNGNYSTVKDKIEDINKQIEQIDKQITELQKESAKKALDKKEEAKKDSSKKTDPNADDPDAEKSDATTEQMSNLLSVHGDMKTAQMAFSKEKSGKTRIAILDYEIKHDGRVSESVDGPKHKEMNAIKDRMKSWDKTISEKMKNINQEIKENSKDTNDKNVKDDKNSNSDKIVGSNISYVA